MKPRRLLLIGLLLAVLLVSAVAADSGDKASTEPADSQAQQSQAEGKDASLSEEELDAELKRLEKAENTEGPKEYQPSRPLAADVAIALPSDI